MEYTAALEGLRSLPAGSRVCIVTDSRLMLDSMTRWIDGWKRKGWKTAGGDPVKNQDLVQALDAEIARHAEVRWHWVRGHETAPRTPTRRSTTARTSSPSRRRPPRGPPRSSTRPARARRPDAASGLLDDGPARGAPRPDAAVDDVQDVAGA